MKFKFDPKAALSILFAIGTGVAAFFEAMDSQKKNQEIDDMKKRISNLERGGK